ncbi:hypothetical protein L0337_19365, partial [candidate division KSB1 bacterium]|nr:hypothetical protein [candidate division KSB1 bacterium]
VKLMMPSPDCSKLTEALKSNEQADVRKQFSVARHTHADSDQRARMPGKWTASHARKAFLSIDGRAVCSTVDEITAETGE